LEPFWNEIEKKLMNRKVDNHWDYILKSIRWVIKKKIEQQWMIVRVFGIHLVVITADLFGVIKRWRLLIRSRFVLVLGVKYIFGGFFSIFVKKSTFWLIKSTFAGHILSVSFHKFNKDSGGNHKTSDSGFI